MSFQPFVYFSQFRINFCFGESNHNILVWRVNIAIESGVVCVHDKVEVLSRLLMGNHLYDGKSFI